MLISRQTVTNGTNRTSSLADEAVISVVSIKRPKSAIQKPTSCQATTMDHLQAVSKAEEAATTVTKTAMAAGSRSGCATATVCSRILLSINAHTHSTAIINRTIQSTLA